MIKEGYDKVSPPAWYPSIGGLSWGTQYRGSFFKIPITTHWIIVASDPRFIDEIRQAPEEHLSFHECFVEVIHHTTYLPYDDEVMTSFYRY